MKYIALTGQIASGKTAVAKALEARGYLLVSYTDLLKEYVAEALSAVGVNTSLRDILADKERYRALIQEFGTIIGFDEGGPNGHYVHQALAAWARMGRPPAVFDNVRTEAQAAAVEDYGFTVVQLKAHLGTRTERLRAAGKEPASVLLRERHPIEAGLADECIGMEITTDIATPEMVADFLVGCNYFDDDMEDNFSDLEGHADEA